MPRVMQRQSEYRSAYPNQPTGMPEDVGVAFRHQRATARQLLVDRQDLGNRRSSPLEFRLLKDV